MYQTKSLFNCKDVEKMICWCFCFTTVKEGVPFVSDTYEKNKNKIPS